MPDSIKLARAVKAGITCEQLTGLPREVTVAQWALESGWGDHEPQGNCFGIKEYPGCCGIQELITTEVIHGVFKKVPQWFATFPSITECFTKHAELITGSPRYADCWNGYLDDHDLPQFILGMARIYATDLDYAKKIFGILNMVEVKDALGTSFNIHTPPTPTAA